MSQRFYPKSTKVEASNVFFTADTHFDHANVIKYSNRPFQDIHQMNEELVERWNLKVPSTGIIYFIGDFCFRDHKRWNYFLERLNGTKHLIIGNHDKANPKLVKGFSSASFIKYLKVSEEGLEPQGIYLSHCAHRTWPSMHYGHWHLHGHSHGSLTDDNGLPFWGKILDVGVDSHNYTPLSYFDIKEIMKNRRISSNDDHKPK